MNVSIYEFTEQINQIKQHLEVFEKYDVILKNQQNADTDFIKSNMTQEKVFLYRSNIISLYGAFEHFIESIIQEYIKSAQKYITSFNKWGNQITKNYFDLWKKLHGNLNFPKFNSINETMMVDNLHKVICNNESSLIPQCFLQNGGNYKPNVINEMFNNIGIKDINASLLKYEPLKTYLVQQHHGSENLELSNKLELYYNFLEDLVDRRNEIAHGAISDNLLNNELFRVMLLNIEKYATSMNYLLMDKVYEKKWMHNCNTAIKIDNVYHQNVALLCLSDINTFIAVGNKILVNYKENDCSRFFEAIIEEMRVDIKNGEKEKIINSLSSINDLEAVTIKISHNVKAKQQIKLL